MSGCHAGVHVHLRKFMPKGIYLHCSAHRLNLVINDTCKVVCYMSDYFSIVANTYSFFTESGVTNTYFKQAQQELGLGDYYTSTLSKYNLFLFYFHLQFNLLHSSCGPGHVGIHDGVLLIRLLIIFMQL